jgi:hypothetical protein
VLQHRPKHQAGTAGIPYGNLFLVAVFISDDHPRLDDKNIGFDAQFDNFIVEQLAVFGLIVQEASRDEFSFFRLIIQTGGSLVLKLASVFRRHVILRDKEVILLHGYPFWVEV